MKIRISNEAIYTLDVFEGKLEFDNDIYIFYIKYGNDYAEVEWVSENHKNLVNLKQIEDNIIEEFSKKFN